jgi:hypothetical protein
MKRVILECMNEVQRPLRGQAYRPYGLLALIILLFVVQASWYNRLIPPFEGPDEAQHFAYVQWLAAGRGLPPQGATAWETPLEQEASQPPLYYFLAAIPVRLFDLTDPVAIYRPNPHYPAPMPHQLPDNENRAIHYAADTRPLRGAWLGLYVARGVTLFTAVWLIIAVFGLARQLSPDSPGLALGAAFVVAATPQVLFLSTMVSNDIPAALFSTLTLWGLVVWLKRATAPSFWSPLLTGVSLGLASLTKVSALLLVLPVSVGLLWWGVSRRRAWSALFREGVVMAVSLTAVAGWWYLYNWWRFGSPVGLETHSYAPWSLSQAGILMSPTERWIEVIRSAWIALGWGAVRPDGWAYAPLWIFLVLAGTGLLRLTWHTWSGNQPEARQRLAFVALLLLAIAVMALFLEVWMRQVVATHGRLLFPTIGAIATLLVLGWHSLHRHLPWLVYAYLFAWALLTPWLLLQPAFQPRLLTASEAAILLPRLGWLAWAEERQPLAEIIRVTVPQKTAVAGDVVPVELCWQALGETTTNYSFMVQFIGPDNGLAAARRTYPAHGLHPTSQWQPGDAACETVHIQIPPELDQTLVYAVEVGLINHETGASLRLTDAVGNELPDRFVGKIRLATAQTSYATLPDANGAPLHLLDYQFDTDWRRGEVTLLSLQWAAARPLAAEYQVFVHLRDAQSGVTVAQADGPPLAGWYPTSWWPPGEIITDRRSFAVPDDLADGRYILVVGFYDLATGERLGREHVLGTVTVTDVINPA